MNSANRGHFRDSQKTCKVYTRPKVAKRNNAHMGVRVGVLTGEGQGPYTGRPRAPLGQCVRHSVNACNKRHRLVATRGQTEMCIGRKLGQSIGKMATLSVQKRLGQPIAKMPTLGVWRLLLVIFLHANKHGKIFADVEVQM